MKYQVKETNPCAAGKETYTYGDYETWPEDQRWELIDGIPYDMTPAPSPRHQGNFGRFISPVCRILERETLPVISGPF